MNTKEYNDRDLKPLRAQYRENKHPDQRYAERVAAQLAYKEGVK
jgi:hypothetical protein